MTKLCTDFKTTLYTIQVNQNRGQGKRTLFNKYEGNSKSKVPYFIPAERIPALGWQA
jgi:hypothetical protein